MRHTMIQSVCLLPAALIAVLVAGVACGEDMYHSPLALAASGDRVYVADHTANQVVVFDVAGNVIVGAIAVPGPPTGLVAAPDATLLYVTTGGPDGQVCVIRLSDGGIVSTWPAGHTPGAPTVTPDGKTLFVCNPFNNSVTALNLSGGTMEQTISVGHEPSAAVMTPDGARLLVVNLLPASRADGDYVSATVDVVDVAGRILLGSVKLPNGSSSLLGIALSPDGQFAYVTHILSRYQLPTTQLERGWINTNAVTIIDVARMEPLNTILLDDVDLGAANPWGIACTADGKWLCVAHSGTHELSIIDRARLHEKLAASAAAGVARDVPNDLSYILDLRRRVRLEGKGPRGMVALGSRVFAAEYFSGTVASVDLAVDGVPRSQSFAIGAQPAASARRAGELFFHDGTVCFQQWQSCASCHPGDARVDGLNWDLLNDGMGNPKNTKSLLLSYETPPTTAVGVREDAMISTRSGIRYILFNQVSEEHAAAVDEYLKALKPVPSPRLVQGALSPAAERGKVLFERAQCGVCHPAPLYTDLQTHDIGTGRGREAETPFDTPTLMEIWRTAPYLHDGRAATLKEMLTTFNEKGAHGDTASLSANEMDELIEYVLSL
ncbi:MAG: cell surface protein [Candidatus Hydrogenedentes bacterium]|nr:cell surface protein [Candidatus Hydrogenedentota bacterium]